MKMLQFTCQLTQWHNTENNRDLPWKGEKDAYKIWLSEIILQQTRVEQGLKYFFAFVDKYPTVKKLATAKDEEVFKLWEGLGYYSRCRNLLSTARFISEELNGTFPNTYESILKLKGIGPYTAAAISSFAYNLPNAVLDGNVFRVLSRCFNINLPIDSTAGKKYFAALAESLLDKKEPALYNQAIMDLGATICKPANPQCNICPENNICEAYHLNIINKLPVKEKFLVKKNRWFTYFVFTCNGRTFVNQRLTKDIWQNLHEYFLVENNELIEWTSTAVNYYLRNELDIEIAETELISTIYTQKLTHQTLFIQFIKVGLNEVPKHFKNCLWLNKNEIATLAFPKTISKFNQSHTFTFSFF